MHDLMIFGKYILISLSFDIIDCSIFFSFSHRNINLTPFLSSRKKVEETHHHRGVIASQTTTIFEKDSLARNDGR